MNNNNKLPSIDALLLVWYDAGNRKMPWRESRNPYHIWVSEIMLQQTRVETVIPYYQRFIEALPDIASLAAVDEQSLFKLWEGLGYYRRVQNMQKAAQAMMREHGGKLPNSFEELLALPGIGLYSAGAIASIAYGARVSAVDGNVLRVVSRLLAQDWDIGRESTKKTVRGMIEAILPQTRAGDFNQALMELGATVCVPADKPKCALCPLASLCAAYELGTAHLLPAAAEKKARAVEHKTVFLLFCQGRAAIELRTEQGVLKGLWQFPNTDGTLTAQESKAALEELYSIKTDNANIAGVGKAKHIFTHKEWHMTVYKIELRADKAADAVKTLIWATADELAQNYPIPSAFKYALSIVKEQLSLLP